MTHGRFVSYPDTYGIYGESCIPDDIIVMELNVANQLLRFYRNGKDFGDTPKKIKMGEKYYMAISIYGKCSFQILKYEEEYK